MSKEKTVSKLYIVFVPHIIDIILQIISLILGAIHVGQIWSWRFPVQGRPSLVSHCELRGCLYHPAPPRLSMTLLAWIASSRCLTGLLLHVEEVELLMWDSLVCLAAWLRNNKKFRCLLAGLRSDIILHGVPESFSDFHNTIRCNGIVVLWKLNRDASRPIEWTLLLLLGHLTSELLKYFILQFHSFTFIHASHTFISFKLLIGQVFFLLILFSLKVLCMLLQPSNLSALASHIATARAATDN